MLVVDALDAAAVAVGRAALGVRERDCYAELADLAEMVGALRQLLWRVDTLTAHLAAAYRTLEPSRVGHDAGEDPTHTIGRIVTDLTVIGEHLTVIDRRLGDVHNTASVLHSTPR